MIPALLWVATHLAMGLAFAVCLTFAVVGTGLPALLGWVGATVLVAAIALLVGATEPHR